MNLKFYTLTISAVKRETADTVSISFDIPEELRDIFCYIPGQYLTIKIETEHGSYRRAFSISSSFVFNEPITITVKRMQDGFVSNYINDNIKPGSQIEVFPPLGHFTIDIKPDIARNIVLIGGGSGIAPLFSILKTVLKLEHNSKVILIYSNTNENSIIFKNDLYILEKQHEDRLKVIHVLSKPSEPWEGLTGRLDEQKTKSLIEELIGEKYDSAEFYICAPEGMMNQVKTGLIQLGIYPDKIHFESFTAPLPDEFDMDNNANEEDYHAEYRARQVKIRIYYEDHAIDVQPDETILQAGIAAGLEPPFSCQIGACATCKAKLLSGRVHMDEREALTDDEIEDGYILTCQSHPLTDDVYVDYDE